MGRAYSQDLRERVVDAAGATSRFPGLDAGRHQDEAGSEIGSDETHRWSGHQRRVVRSVSQDGEAFTSAVSMALS